MLCTATNYKTNYILNKVPLSIYILLKINILKYTSQDYSRQLSPMIQLLKSQPLD